MPTRYRYGVRRCDPSTDPTVRRFEVYDKTTGESASVPRYKHEAQRLARQWDEANRHQESTP